MLVWSRTLRLSFYSLLLAPFFATTSVTMAVSEMAATFGPFMSWMFLPGLATKIFLNFLYNSRLLTMPTTPVQADLHTRRIRTLVIVSYLFYTIYASLFLRPTNFYELLQVDTHSETEVIRRSFRRLARIYHPDKISGGLKNEALFIDLRTAHDCLVEPVKRMAYDRFGSVVLEWTEAITLREYFTRGLQNSLAFYVINPAMFGFIHWLNGQRIINYWQFSILSFLLSLELSLILNPTYPNILSLLPSQTTQHDVISALHTTYIAMILASNHLSNLLPTPRGEAAAWQNRTFDKDINEMKEDLEGFRLAMQKMENHHRALAFESERALSYSLLPLRPKQQDTVHTRQEAAESIATGRAERKPSAAEETYINLLSRLIFRARVSSIPGVQEVQSHGVRTVEAIQGDGDESEIVREAARADTGTSSPNKDERDAQSEERAV